MYDYIGRQKIHVNEAHQHRVSYIWDTYTYLILFFFVIVLNKMHKYWCLSIVAGARHYYRLIYPVISESASPASWGPSIPGTACCCFLFCSLASSIALSLSSRNKSEGSSPANSCQVRKQSISIHFTPFYEKHLHLFSLLLFLCRFNVWNHCRW